MSMDYRIGRLNRFTTGWMAYFWLADAERVFASLDGWLRRRLRQVRWKEWKTTAAKRHNLRIRRISESSARKWAGSSKGYWRVSGSKILQVSLPNSYGGPSWPEDIEPDLAASQSDGLTNRRMRARMSGGVGGGGATPPPPRSVILNGKTIGGTAGRATRTDQACRGAGEVQPFSSIRSCSAPPRSSQVWLKKVPEPVRIGVEVGLPATAGDDLVDTGRGQRPAGVHAEPQLRPPGLRVPGAAADVAVEAAGRLVADLDGPGRAALAADLDLPGVQVQVAGGGVAGVVADAGQCSTSLRMSMTATFDVAAPGREEPRLAGAGRGWWWTGWRGGGQSVAAAASSLMAVRAGGFVDGLAGSAGGQERGDGEPVDGAGQAAGVGVDGVDGVVGEQGVGSAGVLKVAADVSGGFSGGAGMW